MNPNYGADIDLRSNFENDRDLDLFFLDILGNSYVGKIDFASYFPGPGLNVQDRLFLNLRPKLYWYNNIYLRIRWQSNQLNFVVWFIFGG